MGRYSVRLAPLFADFAGVREGHRVLDVGAGTGALTRERVARGATVVAVEPSPDFTRALRSRFPQIEVHEARAEELPFADDSFDVVLTVAVLHHVADPDDVRATLAEMVRVTRPGGGILIWDHNPRNPYWGSLMARVPQDTGEERLIGEREISSGLRAAGARVVLSTQLGLVPDFPPPAALRLAAAVERAVERVALLRRFAAHNVILATKGPRLNY